MAYAKALASAASRNPAAKALVSAGRALTWGEVAERASRAAAGLGSLGLRPGDRVAILAALTEEQAILQCAASWAGLVVAPMNTRLSPDEQREICKDADVAAIAFDSAFEGRAQAIAQALGVRHRIYLGGGGAGTVSSLALLQPEPAAPVEWPDLALAALIYTGGSTGRPKGVMLPHKAMAVEGQAMADSLGYDDATVYLHGLTMFHVAGMAQFLGVTQSGGAHVFPTAAGPAATFEAIRHLGVNHLCGAPTSMALLLDAPSDDLTLLRKIRAFGYGAASISEALLRRALSAMPNTRFVQFFGQTETCGSVSVLPADRHVLDGPKSGRLGTVGRAHSHYEIRIADAEGNLLRDGETGEIVVRGEAVSLGYWRQGELTAQLFRDGWVHTGDVGRLDEDGFLTVVDRLKDMIVSGGENVYTSEVENVLCAHPAVDSCAVIGVPHPLWGEAVHAIVRLKKDQIASQEDLLDHCRRYIGGYKCPKSISFRTAPLPLSGIGKVMKHELRKEYGASIQAE
ncbi:MAG: class I adenylate-forming enzyme family protein [Hyphomonadaceae bacterium]